MSRYVYISCDENEKKLEIVRNICLFLQEPGCVICFAPISSWHCFYRGIEDSIDRCDAFIAVCGLSRTVSTWLAFELDYASALKRFRMSKRPRVFVLRLENYELPACSQHLAIEWLTEANLHLLLEDLPNE
jgi:hypothetical protein